MKFLLQPEAEKLADQFLEGSFRVNIDLLVLQEILDNDESRDLFVNAFNEYIEKHKKK